MASDDEFRRVAEEIRALARSLARDFRDAVDQSRAGGDRAGEAVRHGLRDVAEEARRSLDEARRGMDQARRGMQSSLYGYRPRPRPRGHRSRHRGWYAPAPLAGDHANGEPADGAPPSGGPAGSGQPWCGGPRSVPGTRNGRTGYAPSTRHRHPARSRRRRGLPPIRHRWDATTVIGTLAVVFGVAWLLDAVHAAHISVEGAVAVGLMLLGAAMIVTGRTDWSLSRRSWPVFAGAALILVLVATSNTFGVGSGTSGLSFGNKTVPVTSSGQSIQGGFGNLMIDASGLPAGGTVSISNVAGNVHVTLPRGQAAHINARVLAGEICIDGRNAGSGIDASTSEDLTGAKPAVVVNIHEASGEIIVGTGGCHR